MNPSTAALNLYLNYITSAESLADSTFEISDDKVVIKQTFDDGCESTYENSYIVSRKEVNESTWNLFVDKLKTTKVSINLTTNSTGQN